MSAGSDIRLVLPGSSPFPSDSWEAASIVSFEKRMLDPVEQFPCIFGVDAVARKTLRYGFVRKGNRAAQLSDVLGSFTDVCEELGKRTSLVVFFESWDAEECSHESYYQAFFELLAETSKRDTQPWPSEHAVDADHPSFEFCFNGVPMFVVVNTELHRDRRSRNFERVAITFQPRFVFDDIKPGTRQGDNARKIIRQRVNKYDRAPLTTSLGDFGDANNNEWRQYYLDDGSDTIAKGRCPVTFHMQGGSKK